MYYIGLDDRFNEGTFIWDDSSNVTYSHWAPESYQVGGDCVVQEYITEEAQYMWREKSCLKDHPYVCQIGLNSK